jgi:hypothetical protein
VSKIKDDDLRYAFELLRDSLTDLTALVREGFTKRDSDSASGQN